MSSSTAELLGVTLKYLGLLIAAGLGVVGTLWETHVGGPLADSPKRHKRRRQLSRAGKALLSGIVLSFLAGVIGVYLEETRAAEAAKAAKAAADNEITRLTQIALLSERSLNRFSGHIRASITIQFAINQPAFKRANAIYQRARTAPNRSRSDLSPYGPVQTAYGEVLKFVVFRAELNDTTSGVDENNTLELGHMAEESARNIYIHGLRYLGAGPALEARFDVRPSYKYNAGMLSASDFGDRRVVVTAITLAPDEADWKNIEALEFVVTNINLFDSETGTKLTEATLTPLQDPRGLLQFAGQTRQLHKTVGLGH